MDAAKYRTPVQVVLDTYGRAEATEGRAAPANDISIPNFATDFAEDIVLEEAEGLPYAGVYKGRDNVIKVIERITQEYWTDFRYVWTRMTSDSEFVVVDGQLSAQARATGKRVQFPLSEIWRVKNDKVVWIRPVYGDLAACADALGLRADSVIGGTTNDSPDHVAR